MPTAQEVALIEAALAVKKPYHTVLRLVLTGRLKGERRSGRWYVDADDLARLLRERGDAPSAA